MWGRSSQTVFGRFCGRASFEGRQVAGLKEQDSRHPEHRPPGLPARTEAASALALRAALPLPTAPVPSLWVLPGFLSYRCTTKNSSSRAGEEGGRREGWEEGGQRKEGWTQAMGSITIYSKLQHLSMQVFGAGRHAT